MLLKFIGITIVGIASSSFGLSLSIDFQKRIKQLLQINKILLLLKGEIEYNNSGIVETLSKVKKQTTGVYKSFLEEVQKALLKENVTLKEAWNYGVDNTLAVGLKLKDSDLDTLKELGVHLGITDRHTQVSNLERCMELIDRTICELNETKTEKCRLYRMLGVSAGVFTAIVLI